jgi:hypothetical protein
VKGAETFQFYQEKAIRKALQDLLDTPTPSGFDNRLDEAANDCGEAGVAGNMRERIDRARWNFYRTFPPERWYFVKKKTPTDCQEKGAYSGWSQNAPAVNDEVIRARFNVTQGNVVGYDDWHHHATSIVQQIPFSARDVRYGEDPKALYPKPGELAARLLGCGDAGQTFPTGWFWKFVDAFAPATSVWPKKKLTLAGRFLTAPVSPTAPTRKLKVTSAAKVAAISPLAVKPEDAVASGAPTDDKSKVPYVVGGILALGAVGGIAYYVSKKGKRRRA